MLALLRNVRVREDQFEKVAESLAGAAVPEGPPVCVDGEGRSFDVALSLKSMLLGLGANVCLAREHPLFRPGSVYLAVSGSGATIMGSTKRMKLAKDAGMETILITENADDPKNEMARMAEHVVELPGIAKGQVAPMGTVFEEAAFLSCLIISMRVMSQLGGVFPPELAALGRGSYGEQYARLLDISENGGTVSGTRGLMAEAVQAAEIVGQLYSSKREIESGLVAKNVPQEMAGELARKIGPDVILAGEGVADCILKMFAQRLYHLSFRAHTLSGTIVPPITKEKLVVALSCSGESSAPVTAAKIASMKSAWFSPITAFPDSSLAEVARGADRQIVRLSALVGYNAGFGDIGGKQPSLPDPVFCAKALLLLDAVIAKEMALLELNESDLKKRHQQDKAEYLL